MHSAHTTNGQGFTSQQHFNYWTFLWQLIFKSLEISEMTVFSVSGQFIGLIITVSSTLAGQGEPAGIQWCILPLHVSNCICKLTLCASRTQWSPFCVASLNFCLSSFCSCLFPSSKISLLPDIFLLCFFLSLGAAAASVARFTDASQN